MRIYFDSNSIIEILERSNPCTPEALETILRKGKHELVFSFSTIMEVSAPLINNNPKANVMRLLNQIEKLPHTFIHSSKITTLELNEALRAFSSDNEYKDIYPSFVDRFDTILELTGNPVTKTFINYSLAEIIWDLNSFGGLGSLSIDKHVKRYRRELNSDRKLNRKYDLKSNYVNMIEKNLKRYNLRLPYDGIKDFAYWIYSIPTRCPSARLVYELWHKMVYNITDNLEDSDLDDYHNIGNLPYVDLMTVDRRMHGYVCQVAKSINVEYDKKIHKKPEGIIKNI